MRFHVHAHVEDLQANIAFYTKMFGAEPVRVESDYAKWEIPGLLNFALSSRGGKFGIDHLGFQADTPARDHEQRGAPSGPHQHLEVLK
jgi:catechol 2,3-dioxygenase-like lactoylglutathione lyase family enzyme